MSINPKLNTLQKNSLDLNTMSKGIQDGDPTMLSRAITLIESSKNGDKVLANQLLNKLPKTNAKTYRIGITGNPGVGKSSLIEKLGIQYINNGHKVAVIAYDPSSLRSGGSILGDKTRMEKLSQRKEAFIRPSPSSGNLGGVGVNTEKLVFLFEAAGYDRIIIETVGVGQNETLIENFVDCFVLIALPGAGDEIQVIKRGIIERTDILAVNKADGDQVNLAKIALGFYKNVLHLFPRNDKWIVPSTAISAQENSGIDDLIELIEKFYRHQLIKGALEHNRKEQLEKNFDKNWKSEILNDLVNKKTFQTVLKKLKKEILEGTTTPEEAIVSLKNRVLKN